MSPAVTSAVNQQNSNQKNRNQNQQQEHQLAAAQAATKSSTNFTSSSFIAAATTTTTATTTVQNNFNVITSSSLRTHMLKNDIENTTNPVLTDCSYANENDNKLHDDNSQAQSNENETQINRQDAASDGTASFVTKLNTIEQAAFVENNNTTTTTTTAAATTTAQVICSSDCQLSIAQTQQQPPRTLDEQISSSSRQVQAQPEEQQQPQQSSAQEETSSVAQQQPQAQQQQQQQQESVSTEIGGIGGSNSTTNLTTVATTSSTAVSTIASTATTSTTTTTTAITTTEASSALPSAIATEQQQQQQQTTLTSATTIAITTTTTSAVITAIASETQGDSVGGGGNTTKTNNNNNSNNSPQRKSSVASSGSNKSKPTTTTAVSSARGDEDTLSKSSDTSCDLPNASNAAAALNQDLTVNAIAERLKSGNNSSGGSSRLSERAKKKSWYNVLYPNYKARSEDFKKLFKEVPNDERLIVEYSCALQRDILVQGRLYVSQNYVCFHANILRWETYVCLKWKDVTSITKEKTALVIPNAILITTAKEKYFFATFTSRDKSFLMLFRVWQNTLMNKQMQQQEIWQWIHNCYGDELGLTSDDEEDYIDPTETTSAGATGGACVESENDLEFVSALEDSSSQRSSIYSATLTTDKANYNTANSNSSQSVNQIGGGGAAKPNAKERSDNNSSGGGTSSGGGGGAGAGGGAGGGVKPKSRSYFFGSRNNSASASGSDTNNSRSLRNSSSSGKVAAPMKVNAKELTLESIKPTDSSALLGASNGMSEAKHAAKDGGGGGGSSGSAGGTHVEGTKRKNQQQASKHNRPRDDGSNVTKQNSEFSPTDNSDSSDSDENKAPFMPTAECTSTHEGRQFMHTILPIHIDTLFNLLFSKSKFLVDFHEARKSTDTNFGGEWTLNEEGRKQRIVNVTVQLTASVGPKTSKVTEVQELRECSKPGELYSIDINSVNAGIPYADSFSVLMHYCLVRTVDDHTMLSVHAQIKYKKSIWGVVKGFIEKNTWVGLEDFFTALLHALQNETCIPPAKGKGRRPRRGTASQIRPLEEASSPAMAKSETNDNALAVNALPAHTPTKTPTTLIGTNSELVAGGGVGGGIGGSKSTKWLSTFVIMMLCFLIVLNVVLLMKLWKLEDRIEDDLAQRTRMPNLSSLKKLPDSHEEWISLLRQQEILHETELKRWHTVLQTAIELLKKTEKTLAALLFR